MERINAEAANIEARRYLGRGWELPVDVIRDVVLLALIHVAVWKALRCLD